MSTSIDFRKMHGLGNDFVVVDARQKAFVPTADQAKHIADRRWGVGCDQLIVLEPSTRADVFMRIYNSDGSQAEACGNATRCIAGLLSNEGASQPSIETLRGVLAVEPASDNRFRIDMGPPIFDPALIPVTAASHKSLPVLLPNFPAPMAVSMGNPHCVFSGDVASIEAIDLAALGQKIETNSLFPARTNVQFIAPMGPQKIRQRVFERGAGITGASGSGACAGAVIALITGMVSGPVEVVLDGGSLWIDWSGQANDSVFMTGPWAESFQGRFEIDDHG